MRKKAAECLLKTEAVFFRPEEPFTWASGIQSPIYCDNRLVLSDPEARQVIEEGMIELIQTEFPQAEALFGTATAGIAHAAIAAHEMGLPMGYVRSSAKDHGRGSRIEGRVVEGQKVVVVEDLISTGGSVISAAEALEEAGAEVLGVVCIFSYNLNKSRDAFAKAGLTYKSL
ncbi:MAG: orotate phosphoribosyltransferase, partial [Oscillospiraceae bacterium]|nr:orotate phosphoribosyltransferase [Oscillospiraceae bacterium]